MGNATGLSDVLADLSGKYLQFAVELRNREGPNYYLWHTEWPDGQARLRATETAAQSAGVELRPQGIRDLAEAGDVLAAIKKDGALVLIVQPSPFTYRNRNQLIESAMSHGLGTIFAWPIAAKDGALIGYGPAYAYMCRRAASFVDRILRGACPGDVPAEEPTKFELAISLKTAKELGLAIPQTLLALADEVIE
jgi:putative tryptophan/tyrosine transport system substrate-binding protein